MRRAQCAVGRTRSVAAVVALALALALALAGPAAAARVVAIGDVHGAYDSLVEILQAAGLVDADAAWSGGDATLVQLGDFTDRGPRVKAVMDLLMRLQEEAAAAGGRVVVLLGNHEALNIVGELRDVSSPALAEFETATSASDLEAEYKESVKAARLRARLIGAPRPVFDDQAHEAWLRAHPPGTVAYLRALLPDGPYGRWLRTLPAAVVIDGVLFLHAGLDTAHAETTPEDINARVRDEIRWLDDCRVSLEGEGYLTLTSTTSDLLRVGFGLLDQLAEKREAGRLDDQGERLLAVLEHCVDYEDWHLFSPDGPLWFRGYAEPRPGRSGGTGFGWSEEEGTSRLEQILAAQGVRHVVVGHSPHESAQIRVRFDGRAFLIDTGMLAAVYRGQPAALELRGDDFAAIYLDRRAEIWSDSHRVELAQRPAPPAAVPRPTPVPWRWYGADGEPLSFNGPEELEEFLRTAEIVSSATIDAGINRPLKVELRRDGVVVHAVFRTVSVEQRSTQGPQGRFYRHFRDDFIFECAAYELARLLGLDAVPPAVPRSFQGHDGSLQAWVENAMTEAKRQERELKPPDTLRWARSQADKQVFDALINNHDRNAGNELVDRDWKVWWIDHTRAFQSDYPEDRIEKLRRITPELWTALRTVDRARVRTVLQPFLRGEDLDYLFERWDRIVLTFRTLIADNGVNNIIVDF